MFDTLEPRRLLAGTVTVTTDYGPDHRTLVTGDAAANAVLMRALFNNWFEQEEAVQLITVYDGRLVVDGVEVPKGHANLYPDSPADSFYGDGTTYLADSSPIFDLGDGDDVLLLEGDQDNAFGDIVISGGRGNDRITADGGFYELSINSGDGDDRVTVRGRTGANAIWPGADGIVGDLAIATGQGKDRIDVLGQSYYPAYAVLNIGGRLRISDNSGPTRVRLAHVRAKRAATIALNRSNDAIRVTSTKFAGETRLLTGDGHDIVRFFGKVLVPDITTALQLGPGGDVFEAERYHDDFAG